MLLQLVYIVVTASPLSAAVVTKDTGITKDTGRRPALCPNACGPGALCTEANNAASCFCPIGWAGDPYVDGCRDQCSTDSDCVTMESCIDNKCRDPCDGGRCGIDALCTVENHVPICQCPPPHIRNPFEQCIITPRGWTSTSQLSLCDTAPPCKAGAVCKDSGVGNVFCRCPEGWSGNPYDGCGAPRCRNDNECNENQACVRDKCEARSNIPSSRCYSDPSPCGDGAVCHTLKNTPVCSCPPGTTGNPFVECATAQPNVSSSLCDPSPCGDGAVCNSMSSTPICSCPPGTKGSPLVKCVRAQPNVQLSRCGPSTCGDGAVCHTLSNNPVCSCPPGTTGDPFLKCVTVSSPADIEPSILIAPSFSGPPGSNKCILPEYPAHASYATNIVDSKPGDAFDIVAVNVTCQEGYVVNGLHTVFCYGGHWSSQIPQCVSKCSLASNPSVEYRCLVSLELMDGFRVCKEYEPSGTLISPICRTHYYSATALKYMRCIDGEWTNVPTCTPECGTLTPEGKQLVIGGEIVAVGEVPWHAGIYRKTTRPYMQICGGSLISNNIVISAAHCFWDNLSGKLPASDFAVAVGKVYRPWDNTMDDSQKSDVESIRMPARFRGSATSYQDDIALVELSMPVQYRAHVRPVCLDFDGSFERRQLQPGNKGKVAGWGLTTEAGGASPVLRAVELPYVAVNSCIDNSPASFTAFITSDKICAGFLNASKALCRGDSGGGLAFPAQDRGTARYFLRGVVSTAPTNDNACNAHTYTAFTLVTKHQDFITRFWDS